MKLKNVKRSMDHVVGLTGKTLGVEYCKIMELLPDGKSL